MDPVLLEDSTHGVVASDLASVTWVLKLVLPNVLPDLLHRLRPRKLIKELARRTCAKSEKSLLSLLHPVARTEGEKDLEVSVSNVKSRTEFDPGNASYMKSASSVDLLFCVCLGARLDIRVILRLDPL